MQITLTSQEAISIGHLIKSHVNESRVAQRALNIEKLMSKKRLFGLRQPYSRNEAIAIVDDYSDCDHYYGIESHRYIGWFEWKTGKRLINAGKTTTNGFVVVNDDDDINVIKCHTVKGK